MQMSCIFNLRQVNGVNGEDILFSFDVYVCICVCMCNGLVNQTNLSVEC